MRSAAAAASTRWPTPARRSAAGEDGRRHRTRGARRRLAGPRATPTPAPPRTRARPARGPRSNRPGAGGSQGPGSSRVTRWSFHDALVNPRRGCFIPRVQRACSATTLSTPALRTALLAWAGPRPCGTSCGPAGQAQAERDLSSGVRLHAWLDELRREQKACVSLDGRPLVTAAFALSQDGCMSASRAGRTILSGDESMRLTHRLRATHDAVLVGIGTVLCDDPQLTTRLVSGRTGLRIVLDSQLRTPKTARVLRAHSIPPLIVGRDSVSRVRVDALREAGADVVLLPGGPSGISLGALFKHLAALGVSGLM